MRSILITGGARSGKSRFAQKLAVEAGGRVLFIATAEAKDVAVKMGIKGDPQQVKECLSCHVTAYGASADIRGKLTNEEGVSCEACHGAGSKYKKMKKEMQLEFLLYMLKR